MLKKNIVKNFIYIITSINFIKFRILFFYFQNLNLKEIKMYSLSIKYLRQNKV